MLETLRARRRSLVGLKLLRVATIAAVAVIQTVAPREASGADSLEDLLGNAEQDKAYSDLVDLLDGALDRPVDLATASRAEIANLPWVSAWLADSILAARSRGGLSTVEDLRKIAGLSDRQFEALRPFVVVTRPEKAPARPRNSLRLRVISSPPTSHFDQLKTYGAYGLEAACLRAGVVVEKDKGEKTLNDFRAYYLEKTWTRAKAIAGNFVLATGHGLVFSDAFGESPGAVDPWRFGRGQFGLKSSASSEENYGLEGLGLSIRRSGLEVCLVGSRSRFDAHIDDQGRATSLRTSGLHVAQSEVEGKDGLTEALLGAAGRCAVGPAQVTLSLARADLNRDLVTRHLTWREDRARLVGSGDLTLERGGGVLFFEAALAEGGGPAVIGGLASGGQAARVVVVARSYSPSFLSLHSRPLAFYSGTGTGEQGVLTSIAWRPSARGSITLSNDVHRRDGASDDGLGTSGSETFADATVGAGDFTLLMGEKLSRVSEAGAGGITEETERLRSRVDVEYKPVRGLEVRARYELVGARVARGGVASRSTSDLLRLDASLAWRNAGSVKAGFYTFTIEDYSSRIYQYEAGLPYYPSLEMLKGDGSRCYAVLSLGGDRVGRAAIKAGRTRYSGGEEEVDLAATYMIRF